MITAEQIKAARALLKWKQTELAERSGLSLPSINNVERAIGSPRVDTIVAIQTTLENAGIAFIGSLGVTLRQDIFEIKEFSGPDFVERQNDDLFACMKTPDDEALQYGLDERKYVEHAPEQIFRYDTYHQKVPFRQRLMVRKDDTFLLAPKKYYRSLEPELMGTMAYIVYKDRLAMLVWESQRAVIIRNQAVADIFARQFNFLWDRAHPVSPKAYNRLDDPGFVKKLKDKIRGRTP